MRELRLRVPITLDEWLASEAGSVGIPKATFTRMLLWQAKRHADKASAAAKRHADRASADD